MENAVRIEPTLYEKLGGEQTIKVVVEEFYVRVLGDPLLSPVFEGVDMARLKRHQALFLSQALGGPKQYEGRDMEAAHAGLGITSDQFDAVAGHLVATLQHFQVEQEDIDTIVAVVAPLKEAIVAPAPETSLYERLGGEKTIKVVVEEFYVRVLADPLLKPAFEGVDMARLKRHQALFLSQALGGPKQYEGRDMEAAHAELAITYEQFDAVGGHLAATLRHFKVTQGDIDAVVKAILPLRRLIVFDLFQRWLRAG